jgi:small subunit ribosomal protein S2
MAINISPQKLLETGAHFGHQARRWNPKMKPYLYTIQEGIHVFDLMKTKEAIDEALEAIQKAVREGKTILLVGTKKQVKDKIVEVAQATGCPYVSERWLGGTISNFDQIKRSLAKLTEMKAKMASGEYDKYTKKEKLLIERDIRRMERLLGGIEMLNDLPQMLFVVDTHKEAGAVKEAVVANIDVVGIVDSNADPTSVTYPIPMNDDASKALAYVLDLVKEAILAGKKPKSKKKENESAS